MDTKICKSCNQEKHIELFVKSKRLKSGYICNCKECHRNKYREFNYLYKKNNPEKVKQQRESYESKNKEKLKAKARKYYLENKEEFLKKAWERTKKKRMEPINKLIHSIRSNIYGGLKRHGYTKKSKTQFILGCDFNEFKSYLESKFETWMNWNNHGKYNGEFNYGWDIDHIIPLSSAKNEDEILKLNHYTNLQPLCSKMNRDIKKEKIII